MRLSEYEIKVIKELALDHFGPGVKVYLFGSRTDDQKRGGDIDLFISHSDKQKLEYFRKIDFITDLVMRISEQKIDVVLDRNDAVSTEFYNSILNSGIEL